MVVSDPIGDLLTRIRNAQAANHDSLEVPSSKMKMEVLRILLDEGYIKSYELVEAAPQNNIKVALKYAQGVGHRRTPVIDTIKRISKPGLRIYVTSDEIPMVKRGLGISIVSTSRGLMTGRAAKRLGIGGEVVATIF
ncbi:MAG: hypothetical protein RLZ42_637 [Armatimonadota bacterium]|jgi:small subunit ribosomal protein S8